MDGIWLFAPVLLILLPIDLITSMAQMLNGAKH